jgi:hypothetical protein
MRYLPLPDNAARQAIDSNTVFEEHRRVRREALRYEGGMYWKRQGDYEYLVRTRKDGRQLRIGPRAEQTEEAYRAFLNGKRAIEQRLDSLRQALVESQRLNKALKVGRTPRVVVDVLNVIDDAGLSEHFTVVGTHALYAYETAAGVRIVADALATQDVDLLWDARKRVQFVTDLQRLDSSMLRVLQRADPSFVRKEGQNESAINAKGFEVDFLRRMAVQGDVHPFRFSDDEDDLWPVQAMRASVLTDAPRFEHVVVASTGHMACMRTIAPTVFVEFKRWMATEASSRAAPKRRRDQRQADIVQALLDESLLG